MQIEIVEATNDIALVLIFRWQQFSIDPID